MYHRSSLIYAMMFLNTTIPKSSVNLSASTNMVLLRATVMVMLFTRSYSSLKRREMCFCVGYICCF